MNAGADFPKEFCCIFHSGIKCLRQTGFLFNFCEQLQIECTVAQVIDIKPISVRLKAVQNRAKYILSHITRSLFS